ncbi:PDR/VanB family oxidoreductase [Mycolicibacterium sp. F2034L]|uniref:PDR/VanB family oxidoreductase n=1 Tax=Mycolicibacterium sp. F2034L TaxID=2926422 RepID=UPI001FF4EE7A|nr:PDR/VanB family oxidoreductase [Mycolicibacterium sp. F2034L]MCK0175389.1 PDR/VanB family oxidoreductase [Mycolicibacterium sp. F2034L]
MKLRVTQLRWEAEDVVSVVLRSPAGDRLPTWTPGAHVAITLPSGLVRQYSLCGPAEDPYSYTIAVFLVGDGRGGSREIHQRLRIGEVLDVGEPRNDFALAEAPGYLFLAGGIGITPILAMIEALRDGQGAAPPWRLVYGGRSRAAMAFVDRLGTVDAVAVVAQDEAGLPDIAAALADCPAGTAVYCCGPPAMIAAVQDACAAHPELSLHVERFAAAAREVPAVADGAFDVELVRSGVTVTVPADRSVLDAVLEVAPDVAYSCAAGFCGTCETKVLAGDVEHRDELLSEDEHQTNATMMICVSRARPGSRLTLDL